MGECHSSNNAAPDKNLFLQACKRNDLDQVRDSLRLGANVNWRGACDGASGLHFATCFNDGELLELFLSQPGVDVNIKATYKDTPLMWACRNGRENSVRRLCQVNGIKLNVRDSGLGWTALHHAVFNNYPQCVEILGTLPNVGKNVAQIADWNMTMTGLGDNRDTFVMYCLKRCQIEMFCCLINNPGVDLDTVDGDGKYLETIAREKKYSDGYSNILDLLYTFTGPRLRMIQEDSLLSRQSGTISSLQSLCRDVVMTSLITNNSQERKVENLVDRLGELELTEQAKETLLGVKCVKWVKMCGLHSSNNPAPDKDLFLQACERNDLDKVRHSLGLGANVNWRGASKGWSGLHIAACFNDRELLELLLSQPGVDVNITDKYNETPLMRACREEHENIVGRLCQVNGIDPNIRSMEDIPVMYCLKRKKIEMARCLINTPGVDLDTVDRDGKYLETIARERNLREILDMMWGSNRISILERIPQCPVCFERFRGRSEVHQCERGHFVCGNCRPTVQDCPTCSGRIMGRCNGFEDFLRALNIVDL